MAQEPHLIGIGLTIHTAAATHPALIAIAVASGIVLLLVLPAMYLLFSVFARPAVGGIRMKRLRIPGSIPTGDSLAGGAVVLWIAVSPWVWGFADSHPAVANHVALVFGFGPLALLIVNLRPAAFVTLAGGMWLAASPWILGYATDHAAWLNELVTGVLLSVLCLSAAGVDVARFVRVRRRRRARTRSAAGETAASHS